MADVIGSEAVIPFTIGGEAEPGEGKPGASVVSQRRRDSGSALGTRRDVASASGLRRDTATATAVRRDSQTVTLIR